MADKNLTKKQSKFFDEPIEFGRPIITKGRIFAFHLKSCIRQSEIKEGNCVSIVWDEKGNNFYGLVLGEESHIFLFDSNSAIEDIGKIEVENPVVGVLVYDNKDTILCIVTDHNYNTKIFTYNLNTARRMYSHMWGHFAFDPINFSGSLINDEIIYSAVNNDFDSLVYLLTNKGNLFSFNLEKNELNLVQTINNKNLSKAMCVNSSNGDIYGVNREGNFWRVSNNNVDYTESQIPCMKNRNYVASVSRLIWRDGKIYGSTSQDAYLFTFDPLNLIIKNLGRPDENSEIRDIDILNDERIFGITANKDRGMGRIFCYSEKHGFQDVGIIQAWQPVHDFAYEPLCIKAGASGDFLIGNGENRNRVFLFCSFPEEFKY